MTSLTRTIFFACLVCGLTAFSACGTAGLADDNPESGNRAQKSAAKDFLGEAAGVAAGPVLVPLMVFDLWRVKRDDELAHKSQQLDEESAKLAEQGKYEDAISSLKQSIALGAMSYKYEALGDYLKKLGRSPDSIRAYKSAFRHGNEEHRWNKTRTLEASLARIQMKLGQSYYHNGDHAKTIDALETSLSLQPDETTVQSIRAIANEGTTQASHATEYKSLLEHAENF